MNSKTTYFAGGCFWGMEDLFRSEKGVINTWVGYCGGPTANPTYSTVSTGQSGHAETIKVEYDFSQTSLNQLMTLFFNIHDPTTKNRQGNDVGSQYRSSFFFQNDEEKVFALNFIKDLNQSQKWPSPIETQVEPFQCFYLAEEEHQSYLQKNPGGYTCHWNRNIL